jgi:hypothetical protein
MIAQFAAQALLTKRALLPPRLLTGGGASPAGHFAHVLDKPPDCGN